MIDEINKDAADAFIAPVQETQANGVDPEMIRVAVEAAVKAALAAHNAVNSSGE